MQGSGNFNIYNTSKPTNKDLVVVFSPEKNIKTYEISVFKDNNLLNTETGTKEKSIIFKEDGTYQIKVKTIDNNNNESDIISGQYIVDKTSPIITVSNNDVEIKDIKTIPTNIATATDNYSGDITKDIKQTVDKDKQIITYTVSDEAGNTISQNINYHLPPVSFSLYAAQITIVVIIALIIYLISKFSKTLKISKRIDPYVIQAKNNKHLSLIDTLIKVYQAKLKKWEKSFEKSIITQKYSNYLKKYATISYIYENGTQIFISKIIIGFSFVLIAFFAKVIQFKLLSVYELTLPFLVGFFLLDVIYFIKNKAYQNKLENDLLSAIIIMNNAFKSGRSIVQAIDIVSKEMEGQIAKEFEKMSLELSYGLEIDAVFKRFANRIKLDEVNYLTASLTILNKTGGNIIEVFSSIEKTMFNKKKLKLELKSLTSSSRLIVYVLFVVPFLFILFISIISPGYFSPFVTTNLGRILSLIMFIYYLIFIYAVRKIMKVVI